MIGFDCSSAGRISGEGGCANPGQTRVVANICDFIDELRKLLQLRERLRGHAKFFQLQRDIGNHAGEVAISRAFAIAVDGALNVSCAGFECHQRIGHAESDVVVRVNSDASV